MIDEKVNGKQQYKTSKQLHEDYLQASSQVELPRGQQNLFSLHEQKIQQREEQKTQDLSGLQRVVYEFKELIGRGESFRFEQKFKELKHIYSQAESEYKNTQTALEKVEESLCSVRKEKVDYTVFIQASKGYYQNVCSRKDAVQSELEAMVDDGFSAQTHEKRDEFAQLRKQALNLYNEGQSATSRYQQLINREEKLSTKVTELTHKAVHLQEQLANAEIDLDMYELHKEVNGNFNPHRAQDLYERLGALAQDFQEMMGSDTPTNNSFDERFSPSANRKQSTDPVIESWNKLPRPE